MRGKYMGLHKSSYANKKTFSKLKYIIYWIKMNCIDCISQSIQNNSNLAKHIIRYKFIKMT